MARTRVSNSAIEEIRRLGMAKSLVKAQSGDASPEFKEAVRRFYPKAKVGSKTRAAAARDNGPTQTQNSSGPTKAPSVEGGDREGRAGITKASPAAIKAAERRVHGDNEESPARRNKGGSVKVPSMPSARKHGVAGYITGSVKRQFQEDPNYRSKKGRTPEEKAGRWLGDQFSERNPNSPLKRFQRQARGKK